MVSAGQILKLKEQMSVAVIGGADGPTSIFLAGKLGSGPVFLGMVAGIVLLAIGIFIIIRKQ